VCPFSDTCRRTPNETVQRSAPLPSTAARHRRQRPVAGSVWRPAPGANSGADSGADNGGEAGRAAGGGRRRHADHGRCRQADRRAGAQPARGRRPARRDRHRPRRQPARRRPAWRGRPVRGRAAGAHLRAAGALQAGHARAGGHPGRQVGAVGRRQDMDLLPQEGHQVPERRRGHRRGGAQDLRARLQADRGQRLQPDQGQDGAREPGGQGPLHRPDHDELPGADAGAGAARLRLGHLAEGDAGRPGEVLGEAGRRLRPVEARLLEPRPPRGGGLAGLPRQERQPDSRRSATRSSWRRPPSLPRSRPASRTPSTRCRSSKSRPWRRTRTSPSCAPRRPTACT
jgi:hypothetical protein